MYTVKQLLDVKPRSVVTIAPDASVFEALELMARATPWLSWLTMRSPSVPTPTSKLTTPS